MYFRSAFIRQPFVECKAEPEVRQRADGEEAIAADGVPLAGKLDPVEAKAEDAEIPTGP